MSIYSISYRYAKSLLKLSEEKNIFDKISSDAKIIYGALSQSRELRAILKSPVVKTEVKINLLSEIFSGKVSGETISFMKFVVEKGREDLMSEIFRNFLSMCDKKLGILDAKITSSIELDNEIRKNMLASLEKYSGMKIRLDYATDEKMLGGFIVRYGDTVIDASVKHQLELLRKKFFEEYTITNN